MNRGDAAAATWIFRGDASRRRLRSRPGARLRYSPQSLRWSGDGSKLYFEADVRARRRLCALDVASREIRVLGADDAGSTTLKGHGASGLVVARDSLSQPAELALLDASSGAETRLTFFNDQKLAAVDLGAVEEVLYKTPRPGRESEGGAEIQAWLLKPSGFDETKRYPLAVIVHGGPQGSTGDDWHYRWNLQSYASAGFVVLAPNFRGSTGFGHAYCRDISGDWAIGPDDSVAGVEHVLATRPWIDADRVVGLGASYGGFSMNYLNGHAPKNMFKALVNHDGVFDMRSSYWSTEELFFMEKEFGGPPCEAAATTPDSPYNTMSPALKVAEWRTPTLVIQGAAAVRESSSVDDRSASSPRRRRGPTRTDDPRRGRGIDAILRAGDKDYRLVTSEALATFTALQRQGVESELLFLPDENHHCLNPQNSLVWHDTVLSWIRRWAA